MCKLIRGERNEKFSRDIVVRRESERNEVHSMNVNHSEIESISIDRSYDGMVW